MMPAPATDTGAPAPVFISYASEDAAAALALCKGLESAGIACWIAPRNVRPGDLYADAIVHAINACRILLLVLSENSVVSGHVLREVERASAKQRPIMCLRIAPVDLPPALEFFLSASHWLEASGGEPEHALPALIDALRGHLDDPSVGPRSGGTLLSGGAPRPTPPPASRALLVRGALAVAVLALACFVADRVWWSKTAPAAATPAAFSPPPHSIAVLPFVNMSGDAGQEYFADGLSEELLNSLAAIRDLRVAARTSSFSFKGKSLAVGLIARELNVGAILEGSIRKDGMHVRIAAQLINALTGFRLWSESYDRDLKDILKLQTDIATAVTTSLQATLLGDTASLVELGGTQDPRAFDAFLRGERLVAIPYDKQNAHDQIAAYSQAVSLDPRFAKAYSGLALARIIFASNAATSSEARSVFEEARASAEKAVELAPALGEAHAVLGFALDTGFQDYAAAAAEHERALDLSPGNSRVLMMSARFLAEIGRTGDAVVHAQRAAVLDPLNANAYRLLGQVYLYTHHYAQAISAYDRALRINPQSVQVAANRGLAQAALGDLAAARESCAAPPLDWLNHTCLAIVLRRLDRPADAQAELATLQASAADEFDLAYQYAQIYAQWGAAEKALGWLDTAYRVRDPGLAQLKVDNLMDPLRSNPRFETLLAKMKFPD